MKDVTKNSRKMYDEFPFGEFNYGKDREKYNPLLMEFIQSIDTGKTITRMSHPVNYDSSFSIDENIQRLRDEITPLFSKIMFKTFKIISE